MKLKIQDPQNAHLQILLNQHADFQPLSPTEKGCEGEICKEQTQKMRKTDKTNNLFGVLKK